MIKYSGEKLYAEIVKLMKSIFIKSQMSEEWKSSILVPVFKKVDRMNLKNYKGIQMLSSFLKITTKKIHEKLKLLIYPMCSRVLELYAVFMVKQQKRLLINRHIYVSLASKKRLTTWTCGIF